MKRRYPLTNEYCQASDGIDKRLYEEEQKKIDNEPLEILNTALHSKMLVKTYTFASEDAYDAFPPGRPILFRNGGDAPPNEWNAGKVVCSYR